MTSSVHTDSAAGNDVLASTAYRVDAVAEQQNESDSQLDRDRKKIITIKRFPDQTKWPGAGSNRRPSDFQFKVHLIEVGLPDILLAVVAS